MHIIKRCAVPDMGGVEEEVESGSITYMSLIIFVSYLLFDPKSLIINFMLSATITIKDQPN